MWWKVIIGIIIIIILQFVAVIAYGVNNWERVIPEIMEYNNPEVNIAIIQNPNNSPE